MRSKKKVKRSFLDSLSDHFGSVLVELCSDGEDEDCPESSLENVIEDLEDVQDQLEDQWESLQSDTQSEAHSDSDASSDDGTCGSVLKFRFLWSLAFISRIVLMTVRDFNPQRFEANISAASSSGYSLIWVLLVSTFFNLLLHVRAGSLGIVSEKNLASHYRQHHPHHIRIVLWIISEFNQISNDLQNVLTSALALRILSNGAIPIWGGALFSLLDAFVFVTLRKQVIQYWQLFCAFIVTVLGLTFTVQYFTNIPPQIKVLKGMFIPYLPDGSIGSAISIIGSANLPESLYLSSEVALPGKGRLDNRPKPIRDTEQIRSMWLHFTGRALLTFLINLFMLASVANINYAKCKEIREEMSIMAIGGCLKGNFGGISLYIWAIGLLASVQFNTIAGTHTGKLVLALLDIDLSNLKRALVSRLIVVVPAALLAGLLKPDVLNDIPEWLDIFAAFQLPYLVIPILYFNAASSRQEHTVSIVMDIILWMVTTAVSVGNFCFFYSILTTSIKKFYVAIAIFCLLASMYGGILVYVMYFCFVHGSYGTHNIRNHVKKYITKQEPTLQPVHKINPLLAVAPLPPRRKTTVKRPVVTRSHRVQSLPVVSITPPCDST